MKQWLQDHPIAGFLLLTFSISWLIWIPGVVWYVITQPDDFPIPLILLALLGAYGPSAAAVIMTKVQGGSVRNLFARMLRWRVGFQWWLAAILIPPFLALIAALIYGALTGNPPGIIDYGLLTLAPLAFLAALPFGPLGEELGWRGYLLPHLQEATHSQTSRPTFDAALLVGLAWFLWHIPLFWVPGAALPLEGVGIAEVALYLVQTVATSILIAWVFNGAQGSVLIAILMHASVNSLAGIAIRAVLPDLTVDQSFQLGWLRAAISWAVIGALIAWRGRELRG